MPASRRAVRTSTTWSSSSPRADRAAGSAPAGRTLLRVDSAGEEARAIAGEFEDAGAEAVTLRPREDAAELYEPEPGAAPGWSGATRVEALFGTRAGALKAAADVAGRRRVAFELEPCPDRDWVAAGREGFRARRIGGRLWVVPAWCDPPDPQAVNVVIEPGLAFGTGEHPTTALCLEWLAAASLAGRTVIDYGTGSGILAVAALLLGAASATAVDTDPQALEAARANAARNAVVPEVLAPGELGARSADVVVANLLAVPLVELASELLARTAPGGRLVLAGVDERQADVVAAAYADGARLVGRAARDGWVRLDLRRIP